MPGAELTRQREVVDAFLRALRGGDLDALLAVLDPDLVVRTDAAGPQGAAREIRGARVWATQALAFSRTIRFARPALVDGAVGVVMAPRGRLFRALRVSLAGGKITAVEVIADRARLRELELAVLDDGG